MAIRNEKPIPGFDGYFAADDGTITKPCGKNTRGSLNRSTGYYQLQIEYMKYTVHRLVASAWVKNPRPDLYTMCDHIDENGWNNRPQNLRWVSNGLNARNSTHRYGVHFHKEVGMWRVQIYDANSVSQHLGYFKTFLEGYRVAKPFKEQVFKEIYERETQHYVPITFIVRRQEVVIVQQPVRRTFFGL